MTKMMLLIKSCLPLLLLLISSTLAAIRQVTLEQLCDDSREMQKNPVGFRDIEQIKSLIKEYKQQSNLENENLKCNPIYNDSISELETILLNDELLNDVCSINMYNRIRAYHVRFMSIYTPEKAKDELKLEMKDSALEPITPVVRQFFILFVQQIVGICKKQLVERIEAEAHTQMDEDEFQLMERIRKEEFKVTADEVKSRAKKIDQLEMLPPEDDEHHSEIEGQKLYIQVRFGHVLKLISDGCRQVFNPIARELFAPVVYLLNLGYDSPYTRHENKLLNSEQRFKRWFEVIQTCESLKDVVVIHDSSSKSAATDLMALLEAKEDGNKKGQVKGVKIMSKAEAESMQAQIDKNIDEFDHVNHLIYEAADINIPHRPLAFGFAMVANESDEWRTGVKHFEWRTKKLIKRKTDWFLLTIDKITSSLRRTFKHLHKQIAMKDETTVLGRIALFVERHEKAITMAAFALHLIIMFL